MTIAEVIALADGVKPNAFDSTAKTAWISALEGRIAADVFLMGKEELARFRYTWPDDRDTELLVEFPHDDIYVLWLQAQIDANNGEYNKYQNTMQIYNEAYGNFLRWFAQTWDPVQGGRPPLTAGPPYYLTAYGLAVKHGYTGTEAEWVESLNGIPGKDGRDGADGASGNIQVYDAGAAAFDFTTMDFSQYAAGDVILVVGDLAVEQEGGA